MDQLTADSGLPGEPARGGSRFERAFSHAPLGMSVISTGGRYIEANAALARLLGLREEELVGRDIFELTHPDDRRAARDNWRRLVEVGSATTRVELRCLRRDGSPVWVAVTSTMLRDAAGSPLYAVSQTEDITAPKHAENVRRQLEQRFSDLFERCNDMIFRLDLDGVVTSMNPASTQITGFTPNELIGRRLIDLVVEGDVEKTGKMLDRLRDGYNGTTELQVVTKDGGSVYLEASSRLVADGGRPVGVDTIARDTTERHTLQEELSRRVFYDVLTGLPNRALFLDRLNQAVARLKAPTDSVAVMLLGLDDFKAANSRLGHHAADELLKALTPLLQQQLRGSDTIARVGGDEFGLIVENIQNEEHVPLVAGRILAATARLDTGEGPLSASIGVSLADLGSRSEALLENAHTALQRAKRTQRGGFLLHGAEVRAFPVASGTVPVGATRR